MTIHKRLVGGIVLTAASLLIIVAVGIYTVLEIKKSVYLLTDKSTPAQVKTLELQQLIEKISADFLRLGLVNTPAEIADASRTIADRISSLKQVMQELEKLGVAAHGMDTELFNNLRVEIVKTTEQRLRYNQTFRVESANVNTSLDRVNKLVSSIGQRIGSVNVQATGNMSATQATSAGLNATIKKMLTLQNRVKDIDLLLKDLDGVKNKFRLSPIKERVKAVDDAIRSIPYWDGEPHIIKETKEAVAKICAQISEEEKGLIALRERALAANGVEDGAYATLKGNLLQTVEQLTAKIFDAIDPLEVQLVKDKKKMDEAMGFQQGAGTIVSSNNFLAIKAKELGDTAKLIMLAATPAELQSASAAAERNEKLICQEASRLRKLVSGISQTSLAKEVDAITAAVGVAGNAVGKIAAAKKSGLESDRMMQRVLEKVKTVSQEQARQGEAQVKSISLKQQEVVSQVGKTVRTAMTIMAGLSLAIIAIMLVINGRTASAVTGSLKIADNLISNVSSGDFTKNIEIKNNDEIAGMCGNLNGLVSKLCGSLAGISQRTSSVTTAVSEQIATADQLAKRADELSHEAESLSATGVELSATVHSVTENAGAAFEFAKTAQNSAVAGSKVIMEAIAGINELADSAKGVATRIQELSDSSQKISEVVRVIEEIADQTNLLALNAAIEAARAGEQGKGFAVVADEVRSLARKTGASTLEIASMIKSIQSSAGEVNKAISSEIEKINNVVQLTGNSSGALNEIVQSVVQISGMSEQIAMSAKEQTHAVGVIATGVNHISDATSEFAQGIKQIVKATEELDSVATELNNLVNQYKVA